MTDLRFPIGEFVFQETASFADVEIWISKIESFPNRLMNLVDGLSEKQVNWIYRPDGWSIKQVVHHCSDSHMNSFIRFKLALTEKDAVIRPYFEDRWAELSDSLSDDLSDSIALITALHRKWVKFLRQLKVDELGLEFVHPEHNSRVSLLENISFYAWHCDHHLAHIQQALDNKGKF